MPAIPGDAGWTTTQEGCHVWNPLGAEAETASWRGPCVDGRASGQGVLIWRQQGRPTGVYTGQMELGRLNGPGTFVFTNGDRYTGTFHDDLLTGRGTLTRANGNHYEGEFRAWRMHGRGTFTFANGDRYEGEFFNNQPQGQGRLTWKSGEHYEGQVKNGIPDGQGIFTGAGQTYTGAWHNGCFAEGNRRKSVAVKAESCEGK